MKNTLKSTKKIPKTSMGSKRAIEVSICHWIDLLGYGSMLKEVDFNPWWCFKKYAGVKQIRY